MELLRIKTDDYELTLRADGAENSFRRASARNTSIERSTSYSFLGGKSNVFELAKNTNNELQSSLIPASFNTPLHPVFFENKDYYFDILFFNEVDTSPEIYTKLQEVKKSFVLRKIKGDYFLTGAINYGNDIGKTELTIRYRINGTQVNHTLLFEVFPVKLDYRSDYRSIIEDINSEFSSLVFDVLKKTYTGFSEGSEINNDLIWWAVFGRLYKDILYSAKLILNKPHNRLIRDNYFSKADRIKYLTGELEEKISEHRSNTQKYYSIERKTLTVNTPENQFFKYALFFIFQKYATIKAKLLSISGVKITDEFKQELEQVGKDFAVLTHHPFFNQITAFRGMRQESLVLQKAAGYSSFYRTWVILKKGIDFLDGVNKIEMKNIADLYEIWCFLEMKNMIGTILNNKPEEVSLAEILIEGFTVKLRSGRKSRVSFRKDNGDLIELYHELNYSDKINDNTASFTVNQEPDIVLRYTKNDLKDNHQFTYLFDAKYRVESENNENSRDYPPDDAINQMHRYRDAIFYQENNDIDKPKKEVIGAYVLFPGSDNAAETENLYFQKSIPKVNVGAFPLIPGYKKKKNSNLLYDFLKKKLEVKESLNILNEEIIPYKGMKYEDPDAMILVGFVADEKQQEYFTSGDAGIYHMPVLRKNGTPNTIRNLDKLKYFSPVINGIKEYYEIKDIRIVPRREIFDISHPLYKNVSDSYFVFELGFRKSLSHAIGTAIGGNRVFRYAKMSELRSCKTINDFKKTSQENE